MNDSQYIKGLWEESPEIVEQVKKSLSEFIERLGPPVDQDELFGNFIDPAKRKSGPIVFQGVKPDLVHSVAMECHHSVDPAFNNLGAQHLGIEAPIVVTGGSQFRGRAFLFSVIDNGYNEDVLFSLHKEVNKPLINVQRHIDDQKYWNPVEKQISKAPSCFIDDKYIYRKGRK